MKEDWVKIDKGFYIVEESGHPHDRRDMSRQADKMYRDIKEAFEGNIEFTDEPDDD